MTAQEVKAIEAASRAARAAREEWDAMQAEIERLSAEHDDYVVRANANVCELNREIDRLRAALRYVRATAADDGHDGFVEFCDKALNEQSTGKSDV